MGNETSTSGATKKPTFVQRYPELADRKAKADKVILEHPDKYPIICEPVQGSRLSLDRTKLLISKELKVNQFKAVIRRKLQLRDGTRIELFV